MCDLLSLHFVSPGGAPPEAAAVKLLKHFLIKVDNLRIIGERFHGDGRRYGVDMELLLTTAALPRRHFHQSTAALPSQSLPAQPCRNLVHGQHEKVDDAAGTAAAHRRAFRRRPARHLRQPRVSPR